MKTTMKALCATLLLATPIAQAATGPVRTVRIIRSALEHEILAELNPKTVRCLVGDYGASSLKISLEPLKDYTVFRHTTRGEVQPCINAGACKTAFNPNGFTPEMILNAQKPSGMIKVKVVLVEALTIDSTHRTCTRALEETVTSPVRGLKFAHYDGAQLGALDYDLCTAMVGQAEAAKRN